MRRMFGWGDVKLGSVVFRQHVQIGSPAQPHVYVFQAHVAEGSTHHVKFVCRQKEKLPSSDIIANSILSDP